jgi:hypothetical protein
MIIKERVINANMPHQKVRGRSRAVEKIIIFEEV